MNITAKLSKQLLNHNSLEITKINKSVAVSACLHICKACQDECMHLCMCVQINFLYKIFGGENDHHTQRKHKYLKTDKLLVKIACKANATLPPIKMT